MVHFGTGEVDWPAHWETRARRFSGSGDERVRSRLLGAATAFVCCYCEETFPARLATVEHVIPFALGGTYARRNLMLACLRCNLERNRFLTKVLAGRNPRQVANGIRRCVLKGVVFKGGECFLEKPR